MDDKCEICAEKCPQAELAHQAALGRMYATNEFIALLNKVEIGELVEVVRCKDCVGYREEDGVCVAWEGFVRTDDFCSYGERRSND